MECFTHSLQMLFQQLGLPAERDAINAFIEKHSLSDTETLASASFWNESQKQFIEEAYAEDADWTEQIEILDALLRQ